MNTSTISITGNTLTLLGDEFYDPPVAGIYYNTLFTKGRSVVNFDFTSLDASENAILRVKIDYGDGSDIEYLTVDIGLDHSTQPITYYFAQYGNYSPLLIKSHTYEPPTVNTYFNCLTAKFYIELADNRQIHFFFPIKIAQPSFYESLGRINIAATQLISVCGSDVFCALYNKSGDVSNIILS